MCSHPSRVCPCVLYFGVRRISYAMSTATAARVHFIVSIINGCYYYSFYELFTVKNDLEIWKNRSF